MSLKPEVIIGYIVKIAELANINLSPKDINIQHQPTPHDYPDSLPRGTMVIYVF